MSQQTEDKAANLPNPAELAKTYAEVAQRASRLITQFMDKKAKDGVNAPADELGVDAEIVFTGLRPGEKLYEELLMDEEGLKATPNPLIKVTRPMDISREQIIAQLEYLRKVVSADQSRGEIVKALMETVPTYRQS